MLCVIDVLGAWDLARHSSSWRPHVLDVSTLGVGKAQADGAFCACVHLATATACPAFW